MIDTKTNPLDAREVIEHDIREAIKGGWCVSDDDIDDLELWSATKELIETWDGDGWYEVMVDGHTWGYDDAHYYVDREYLGADIYAAQIAARLCDAWAHKVTDPDDIAELEATYF